MLQVQKPLPIVPFLKVDLFSQMRSSALRAGLHTQRVGLPFILEDHSHLTSGVACGPSPNLGLCFRIPPSLFWDGNCGECE